MTLLEICTTCVGGYDNVWLSQGVWTSTGIALSRDDTVHFPQCIASNMISCTGGHMEW